MHRFLPALALVLACEPGSPSRSDTATSEELPAPSWRVVARRDGKVLLAAERVTVRGMARGDDRQRRTDTSLPQEYPTLIFENGELRDGPRARPAPHAVRTDAGPDTLDLYRVELEGRPVYFVQTGDGPTPYESPTTPGLYVIEHDDRLWILADSGLRRLTADTVRGIARDTLRSRTAEGGPYLFWATRPLWSPDGASIAYVTNRTWMLAPSNGQEVWISEIPSRAEQAVLSERGESYSPDGWLGSEVVYTARDSGVFAVDARTGQRRTIAGGVLEAFAPDGSRLLYTMTVGDTLRGRILTGRGDVIDIPDPPSGERLDHGGVFSPRGDRLVLGTSFARDSGITRAQHVFDLDTKRLVALMQWSFRAGRRHPQGLPVWLDDSTLLLRWFDRDTGLESSTITRLPSRR
jgi:hypothetical protein